MRYDFSNALITICLPIGTCGMWFQGRWFWGIVGTIVVIFWCSLHCKSVQEWIERKYEETMPEERKESLLEHQQRIERQEKEIDRKTKWRLPTPWD